MDKVVPILPTNDLAAAKTFYVDGLGFQVTWEHTEDGHSGLMGVARGAMEITLDSPMDGHGRDACVSLHVQDADAYYNEWKSRGVTLPNAPKNEEWGARTFGLLDPSGNTIFVIGTLPTSTPA
ncbi:hypothetical protein F183_A02620 [Bryobacterales bacterium F-183]|nr:hypothetical protein F183_A02620 [Bryobacterales bacterium F-183]